MDVTGRGLSFPHTFCIEFFFVLVFFVVVNSEGNKRLVLVLDLYILLIVFLNFII